MRATCLSQFPGNGNQIKVNQAKSRSAVFFAGQPIVLPAPVDIREITETRG
jgi:hypothetical protein